MRARAPLGLFLFLCLLVVSTSDAATAAKSFTVTFSQERLRAEERYLAEDTYDLLELESLGITKQLGHPCLPVKDMSIYVPRGSRVKSVTLVSVDQTDLAGDYMLLPGQREMPYSSTAHPKAVPPEEHIYAQTGPYPASPVRITTSGSLGGRKISSVQVFPVQYVPAERRIVFNREVTFEVEFEDADSEPVIPRETRNVRKLRNDLVRSLVANAEDIEMDFPLDFSTLDPGVAAEYLILCHENHVDEYQLLADWKTRKGIPTEIVTVQSVYASYPGRDDPERLRNCAMEYYQNESTVWLLMTLAAPKARIRGCYCRVGGYVDQAIPGDLYFADMDGDWNLDDDGLWGETNDDVDLYPELFVGRLPENTGLQAAVAVNKVLTYEGFYSLPLDYQLEMLFLAEYADEDTDGAIAKNMIDNESVPARYDPITKLYQSSGNLNKTSAMNALNSGQAIINHDGHGNANVLSIGPSALYDTDMMALTNAPRYSVFYTVACIPGNFENPMGCFGRAFVESPNGGGFFVGNTRYGWYWPGNPGYGTGELFDREFFESIFVRDYYNLGVIHADAKIQRIPYSGGNGSDRWTQFTSNLLGCPETPIWKDTPVVLAASHADSLLAGNHLITVVVTAEGSPAAGASVCLWKGEEIYLVDETDASGEVQFSFSAASSGDILLTATKNGHVPYVGSIGVKGDLSGITEDVLPQKLMVAISPNPVVGPAAIHFALPRTGAGSEKAAAKLSIYDASGRLVTNLPVVQTGNQVGSMAWDRKLDSGRTAPAGIYFVKLSHGNATATTKFVVLK